MNFKERGITVGDLLIIFIFIISTIIFINKINENKKQNISVMTPNEIISHKNM